MNDHLLHWYFPPLQQPKSWQPDWTRVSIFLLPPWFIPCLSTAGGQSCKSQRKQVAVFPPVVCSLSLNCSASAGLKQQQDNLSLRVGRLKYCLAEKLIATSCPLNFLPCNWGFQVKDLVFVLFIYMLTHSQCLKIYFLSIYRMLKYFLSIYRNKH